MGARVLCAVLFVGLLASCALTRPPHGYKNGALYLEAGSRHRDRINCPRSDCERWFLTRLHKPGALSVEVAALNEASALRYSVVLMESRQGRTLGKGSNKGKVRVSIARQVSPDTYLIGVVSDFDGQAFDFSVRLGFAPKRVMSLPPPPKPRFETHSSTVLEKVGYGKDTVAVLIESGAKVGMQVGYRGKLYDGDREIGTVVIEQVYPDGSRAKIQGALLSPVTHATIARIEVPVGLGLGTGSEDEGSPFEFPPLDEDGGQGP